MWISTILEFYAFSKVLNCALVCPSPTQTNKRFCFWLQVIKTFKISLEFISYPFCLGLGQPMCTRFKIFLLVFKEIKHETKA